MHIFDHEKQDGLEELMSSNASISYASLVIPLSENDNPSTIKNSLKAVASFDDQDLYYVQSILVSSSWNKNDDIFDRAEVWNARHTPEHKPTNLEHNEDLIIGHIVSNWPITEDGIIIDENTMLENLPEKYHILTGSVIYRGFSKPELRNRAEQLIQEIEQGTKYVSMECLFKGFDYGLLDTSDNSYHILARNNDTSYLTKYLRAYGGAGQHQNYKIGRVLRNITFTGKGFVDKPANEDSIIFSKNLIEPQTPIISAKKNEDFIESGVLSFQSNEQSEILTMSSATANETTEMTQTNETVIVDNTNEKLEATITDLNSKVESLNTENQSLKAALSELTENSTSEIATLTQTLADTVSAKESLEATLASLTTELQVANETIAGYKTKEEEMMKKEKKMKRMASLVDAGLDSETAESTADKFDNLDDDSFDVITSLLAAKKTDKKEEEMMKKEEEDKKMSKADVVDASALDNVEVEESVNLSIGNDDTESALESTRAALIEFVSSTLGKKNNK
jgi:hypothetical protein